MSSKSINIHGVDIIWDLETGSLNFLDIPSTLFWNNPSLLNMFQPLVQEIGKEMFCLKVAHSSSLGTDLDYEAMVTQLGSSFEEGFLNWGKAVSGAGWGTFEIASINFEKQTAKIIVYNPWELKMQDTLPTSELWGCPFIQGKIIGIFNNVFESTCWADEKIYFEKDNLRVEFNIYLHELTIKEEMQKLKKHLEKKEILALEDKISEKTKKLNKTLALFGENVVSSSSDLKGYITYASPALCRISEFSKEELIGHPHSKLRHPDTPSEIFKNLWKTIKEGQPWYGEIKNLKKNGGHYWLNTSIMPEFDSLNNVIGYTSIKTDITAQKSKEDFMANMSHELRTPLNAIMGFSSILTKKQTDSAKIKNSSFIIDPFNFNAYQEILKFTQQFDGFTHLKTQHFNIKINPNLKATFYGDWNRINQIALNLISNAIKFTTKGGLIDFSGEYKDGNLILCISDSGIGMSQNVQDRIFQPFEQADGSTTRKYGGTGLGLSITQNLVELMHGTIELESAKGVGTTFKVSIPLVKQDAEVFEDSHKAEENKENTLKGHILIAEDNKTNQILIKMLVEDFGLTCDMANDGIEVVDIYHPDKHLLVLMDENMPNRNGIEAMKIIKRTNQNVPIIALTANAMEGDKQRFLKAGMNDYISKPIDENVLYSVLHNYLGKGVN